MNLNKLIFSLLLLISIIIWPNNVFAGDLVRFNFQVNPQKDDFCLNNTATAEDSAGITDSATAITPVGNVPGGCQAGNVNVDCDDRHTGWPVGGFIGQGPYSAGSHQVQFGTAPAVDVYPEALGTIGDPVYATICGTIGHYGTDYSDCAVNGCDIYAHIVSKNFQTYFVHLDTIIPGLHSGSQVKKGDLIGYRGQTGQASSGPHTHYMIKNAFNQDLSEVDFNKEVPAYDCPKPGGVLTCHYSVTTIYQK